MPFTEIADRVWVARYAWFDVNITLVGGAEGLLVIDTHTSSRAAREVVDDIRRLGVGEVVSVVNTHEHFDHTFGNAELRAAYGAVPIHATDTAAARTVAAGERVQQAFRDGVRTDPRSEEILATEIVPADHTFSSVTTVDIGDRMIELVHPGRGHTGGDLVVRVPDADVVAAGDLLEESGPPVYGRDSFPLDWPATIDVLLGMVAQGTVVVPGHGAPGDRSWVEQQRADLAWVSANIRDLAERGIRPEDAAGAAEWPWPTDDWRFEGAIARGYAQLPRSQKRLPLI
jgi:glyoxylase-like metal-dependent hydrolase (beta-lactamase superfamily II)